MNDRLLGWRAEFPILETSTYLVSHSLGAMPRGAVTQLEKYTAAWGSRGVRAWSEGWWDLPTTVGDEIGRIIGAPPGSVVMHPNVSVCQSLVLSCFDFAGRRNKVVYEGLDFPSVMYVYEAQRALGARIVVVESDDNIRVPTQKLVEAIDEETLLVPVSHVLFGTGFVQDIPAIVKRAHEVGALVVADLYQSAGTVPVDVTAWDVDFATGGSVKWLCGGPGAGYLYVAPRLHDRLTPRLTGWMAHERPFAFERGAMRYASGAARFLHGTPSVPALLAARAGYAIINEIGVPDIRRKSIHQTGRLLDKAREAGLSVRSPEKADERGGMVVLAPPSAEAIARELVRKEILVDYRPGAGLRISPHFYTSDDELDHVVKEVRGLLDGGNLRNGDPLGF